MRPQSLEKLDEAMARQRKLESDRMKEAQKQREKAELRLQVRLIAAGLEHDENKTFNYISTAKMRQIIWVNYKLDLYPDFEAYSTIDNITDYLYSKGIRAIRPE